LRDICSFVIPTVQNVGAELEERSLSKNILEQVDSSLPTYMKLLLSLLVMFRPFPLKMHRNT